MPENKTLEIRVPCEFRETWQCSPPFNEVARDRFAYSLCPTALIAPTV